MTAFIFFLLQATQVVATEQAGDGFPPMRKLEAERLPDMNIARASHSVFYANGELTVVGGHTAGFVLTPTAEYYSNGKWHVMSTVYPHDNGLSVVMSGGSRVLVAGGHEKNLGIGQSYEAEMYDPATHSFYGFGCLDRNRALAQGVEMECGRVIIVGNHQGNDAFELFDGHKSFQYLKDVAQWRSNPYALPIVSDDVIVFGALWRGQGFVSCDTVDRLMGEPYKAPLLNEWMPVVSDRNSLDQAAFIGDKSKGDYSYLVAAKNADGEMGFILIRDTVFSLLPTTYPVPTAGEWGCIDYDRIAVADRQVHRAYLVGNDSTGRIYVVAVEYDKSPAPITVYCTEPLEDFSSISPVLTPDGDLIVAGGINSDNFSPKASVWLLRTSGRNNTASATTCSGRGWLWLIGSLLAVLTVIIALLAAKRHKGKMPTHNEATDIEPAPLPQAENQEDDLMSRVSQLMDAQQLYLNPDLMITDVADALGVHRNALSACINSRQGCTFTQFVNGYRLQHAKKLLCEAPEKKVSAVGLESGFANERSFFRAFKTATGMTPKEWAEEKEQNK